MKNIYELLRQKETELERLKKELQLLRVVAPLLEEDLPAELQVRRKCQGDGWQSR